MKESLLLKSKIAKDDTDKQADFEYLNMESFADQTENNFYSDINTNTISKELRTIIMKLKQTNFCFFTSAFEINKYNAKYIIEVEQLETEIKEIIDSVLELTELMKSDYNNDFLNDLFNLKLFFADMYNAKLVHEIDNKIVHTIKK